MTEKLFSIKRLEKYADSNETGHLRRHMYNMELSESFYPSVCCLELILRNKIDIVFSTHIGEDWLLRNQYIIGQNSAYISKVQEKKQRNSIGFDKNYIISELNFGFWTFLFTPQHDAILWSQYPSMLGDIFQNSRDSRTKHAANLNKMRFFRNKIFHYGSILQGSKNFLTPEKMHSLFYRYIKDIGGNKVLREVKAIDRFDTVYQKGIETGYITIK